MGVKSAVTRTREISKKMGEDAAAFAHPYF